MTIHYHGKFHVTIRYPSKLQLLLLLLLKYLSFSLCRKGHDSLNHHRQLDGKHVTIILLLTTFTYHDYARFSN